MNIEIEFNKNTEEGIRANYFFEQVKLMRRFQKEYFATKNNLKLGYAKGMEKVVDNLLIEYEESFGAKPPPKLL